MPDTVGMWKLIEEKRKSAYLYNKQYKKMNVSYKKLELAIAAEHQKIHKIQTNNDLRGMNLQDLTGAVVRMKDIQAKMKTDLIEFSNLIKLDLDTADKMEDSIHENREADEAMEFCQEQQQALLDAEAEEDEMQRQAAAFDDDDSDEEPVAMN